MYFSELTFLVRNNNEPALPETYTIEARARQGWQSDPGGGAKARYQCTCTITAHNVWNPMTCTRVSW